jgi:spoIIIJ-associated protein
MTSVEKSARTVEDAVEAALSELGATRDQVEIEVLQEPTRSFLGILGHSEAKVRVSLRASLGQKAQQNLAEMVARIQVPARVELVREDAEEVVLDIQGSDLGLLIGKHGQTLGALQLLVALITNKGQEQPKRIVVDAQGYRARREEALVAMAQNAAHKAKQTGRDVVLEDLGPNERRIIHTTLADQPGVTTRSIGEDPYRKVVVSAAGDRPEEQPGQHWGGRRRGPRPPEQPAPPEAAGGPPTRDEEPQP